ncbi:MAG: sigma-70 family RNA polymerase sigma factor [Planctomycetota bacterium]
MNSDETASHRAAHSRSSPSEPRDSIDALLGRHLDRLRSFIRLRMARSLRKHESADDLLMSVCREALMARDRFRFEGEAALRSWLFTAALRKINKRARFLAARKRDVGRLVLADDLQGGFAGVDREGNEPSPSAVAAANERAFLLEEAMARLPDDYREVITLSRVAGLPAAEIAEQMGRSEGSVRMLLHRALAKLALEMDRGAEPPT